MSQQKPGWRPREWWERNILRRETKAAYRQGFEDATVEMQRRDSSAPLTVLMIALMFVLLLLLLASLWGWSPAGWFGDVEPTTAIDFGVASRLESGTAATSNGALPPPQLQNVADGFSAAYGPLGGVRVLGLPISPAMQMTINGQLRAVQWFERGRMEHWPELAAQGHEYQLGRVGVEYTTNTTFPSPPPSAVAAQPYVVSTADRIYFRETQHLLGGGFLRFWQANGGLRVFGFPISEEFDEVVEGKRLRVQYFERARLEWHSDLPAPNDIQAGLLGRALYLAAGYRPIAGPTVAQPTASPLVPTPLPASAVPGQPTAIPATAVPVVPTPVPATAVPGQPTLVPSPTPANPGTYPAPQLAPTQRIYP